MFARGVARKKKKALIALQGIFGNFLDEKHHLAADKFV